MARLGRRPIPAGRATVAITVGMIGLFIVAMGLGLGADAGGWPLGAIGAALMIIGVALVATGSMRGVDRGSVEATVRVRVVSDPPMHDTEYGQLDMEAWLDSPSHAGQTVHIHESRVPVDKWPQEGEELPVLVAVSDVRRIRILWDRVGPYDERYDSGYEDDGGDRYDDGMDRHVQDPEGMYQEDDDDGYGTRVEPVIPEPLPRRRPSPGPLGSEPSSIAVIEGELIPAEIPAQGRPDQTATGVDFSEIPEPAQPTPPRTGPVFTEGPVLATQPQARPASAGSIHGVGITVLVSNLENSLGFYRDMLGFYEVDGGPESAVLASGDTRVVLLTARQKEPVHKRLVHINLEVGDVDSVYQELRVRGVRFTSPPRVVNRGERLELVAASFKDPDGHGIAITQWKARTG